MNSVASFLFSSAAWYWVMELHRSRFRVFIDRYYTLCLITLAGFPATIEYSGTFLDTTAPEPMIEPLPIFTPGNIIALVPIYTSSLIITGFSSVTPCLLIGISLSSKTWFLLRMVTSGAIITLSPIFTAPNRALSPIPELFPISTLWKGIWAFDPMLTPYPQDLNSPYWNNILSLLPWPLLDSILAEGASKQEDREDTLSIDTLYSSPLL